MAFVLTCSMNHIHSIQFSYHRWKLIKFWSQLKKKKKVTAEDAPDHSSQV